MEIVIIFILTVLIFIILTLPWLGDQKPPDRPPAHGETGDLRRSLRKKRETLRFDRLTGKLAEAEYEKEKAALEKEQALFENTDHKVYDPVEREISRFKKAGHGE